MMTIEIICSQCGKQFDSQIEVEKLSEITPDNLKAAIQKRRWIVEFNGDNFDVYCSKRCSKGF